jgi:hypothetical protein
VTIFQRRLHGPAGVLGRPGARRLPGVWGRPGAQGPAGVLGLLWCGAVPEHRGLPGRWACLPGRWACLPGLRVPQDHAPFTPLAPREALPRNVCPHYYSCSHTCGIVCTRYCSYCALSKCIQLFQHGSKKVNRSIMQKYCFQKVLCIISSRFCDIFRYSFKISAGSFHILTIAMQNQQISFLICIIQSHICVNFTKIMQTTP